MINTHALSIACTHLNNELREPEINKLRKQKHNCHQRNYNLKQKIEKLELQNKILSRCIIAISIHNNNLAQLIAKYNEEMP